ncbi:MAG TPA: alpha-L-fucosidase [Terriglobales bacterium]|jgi:alpha-L-fucosidase|nr:alpha-L-fucosidase [Terriglobales bacterium]
MIPIASRKLGTSLVLILISFSAFAQTANDSPEAIDKIWTKSISKYDAPRAALLKEVDRQGQQGPYRPDWRSLQNYQEPEWYKDAKFGIFIHWGLYSVPAFGSEWYARLMYVQGTPEFQHHVETYGPQSKFGYKDFLPMFKAEHFDPKAWAALFHESGAQYVMPVGEHHDGFPMYQSNLTDWCAGKMGPKRDILGELADAVRAERMHFATSSHRVEHDWFMDGGRSFDSDVNDPKYASFYGPAQPRLVKAGYEDRLIQDWTYVSPTFSDDWVARTAEIVEKYHPDLIFFDWWIGQPSMRDQLARFAAYYYNQGAKRGTGAIINYKHDAFQENSAILDIERGQLTDIRPQHWQTDTSLSNKSWGYIENDTFKTPEFVIHQLADVVSKNGNLLVNIGPRADGTIPEQAQMILRQVGAWLKVNGEAIYGTRPWKKYGEGPTEVVGGSFHDTETKPFTAKDFRFTSKGQDLYAIELGWPEGGRATIHSLGKPVGEIKEVALLGSDAKVIWDQAQDGLHIQLGETPIGKYAYVVRIRMK